MLALAVASPAFAQATAGQTPFDQLVRAPAAALERGDHVEAERAALKLRANVRSQIEPGALMMGQIDIWLAEAALGQGRRDEAVEHYRAGLEILRAQSQDPLEIARAAEALAIILMEQAEYDHAEGLMREVMDIRWEELGPDHIDTTYAALNLATIISNMGRYSEAEPFATHAVTVLQSAPAPDPYVIAQALHILAYAQLRQDRATTAEATLREALGWLERMEVPDDAIAAAILSSLGDTLNQQGRYAEAEPIIRSALARDLAVHGPDDVAASARLTSLAHALAGQGRLLMSAIIEGRGARAGDPEDIAEGMRLLGEAEQLLRRVLDAAERVYGRNHPNVVSALANVASSLASQNRLAEAEAIQRDVVDRYRAAYGLNHPDVGSAYFTLADLIRLQLRPEESLPVYQQALEIKRATLTAPHSGIADVLNNIGSTLLLMNRNDEAKVVLDESLPMKAAIYCPRPEASDGCPGHPDFIPTLAAHAVLRFSVQDRPWAGVRLMSWAEDVGLARTRLRYSVEPSARAEFRQQVYVHHQFVSVAWGASQPRDQPVIAADLRAYLLPDLPAPD